MLDKVEQRLSSELRRVVVDGQAIYEKQYVTNDWDTDLNVIRRRAKDEASLLRQIELSELFGDRLGVVRVASADPSSGTIATHEVPGRTLDELIIGGGAERKKLQPWFLAGRWLRQFQLLPMSRDPASFETIRDPVQMRDYCDLRLKSLLELGYGWPKKATRESTLRTIERLQNEVPSGEFCSVWVHSDFSPGNLLWDGHRLTPIDFAMVSGGHPLADATYLIHRAEMNRIYRPWLNLPVESIRNAVLSGIGMPDADQSPAYRLLMIKHHICRLHTYVRRPARNIKQAWHDRWVRTILRRKLGQLCEA
ncbi:MAG: phosphotransferase [Rubripirellula sp.]|nr:phosphotransferase [Rubripirellula sp.]